MPPRQRISSSTGTRLTHTGTFYLSQIDRERRSHHQTTAAQRQRVAPLFDVTETTSSVAVCVCRRARQKLVTRQQRVMKWRLPRTKNFFFSSFPSFLIAPSGVFGYCSCFGTGFAFPSCVFHLVSVSFFGCLRCRSLQYDQQNTLKSSKVGPMLWRWWRPKQAIWRDQLLQWRQYVLLSS